MQKEVQLLQQKIKEWASLYKKIKQAGGNLSSADVYKKTIIAILPTVNAIVQKNNKREQGGSTIPGKIYNFKIELAKGSLSKMPLLGKLLAKLPIMNKIEASLTGDVILKHNTTKNAVAYNDKGTITGGNVKQNVKFQLTDKSKNALASSLVASAFKWENGELGELAGFSFSGGMTVAEFQIKDLEDFNLAPIKYSINIKKVEAKLSEEEKTSLEISTEDAPSFTLALSAKVTFFMTAEALVELMKSTLEICKKTAEKMAVLSQRTASLDDWIKKGSPKDAKSIKQVQGWLDELKEGKKTLENLRKQLENIPAPKPIKKQLERRALGWFAGKGISRIGLKFIPILNVASLVYDIYTGVRLALEYYESDPSFDMGDVRSDQYVERPQNTNTPHMARAKMAEYEQRKKEEEAKAEAERQKLAEEAFMKKRKEEQAKENAEKRGHQEELKEDNPHDDSPYSMEQKGLKKGQTVDVGYRYGLVFNRRGYLEDGQKSKLEEMVKDIQAAKGTSVLEFYAALDNSVDSPYREDIVQNALERFHGTLKFYGVTQEFKLKAIDLYSAAENKKLEEQRLAEEQKTGKTVARSVKYGYFMTIK